MTAAERAHAPSLTWRLAAALALLLAAGGTAVAVAALAYGRFAAQEAYDRLLIGAAAQIAEAVSLRDGAIVVDLPVSAFELLSLAPDDRVTYAVFAPSGAVVTGDALMPPRRPEPFTGNLTGEVARFASTRRIFAERVFAGTVTVLVGQTTRARDELAWQITRNALVVVALTGVLMSLMAALAVRSALLPLRRIEMALARRSPQDLARLNVPVPREVGRLVQALNDFMGRLDRQVGTMRRLIADASHQIRTPITAIRAQAQLAAEETDPARQAEIIARIHVRAVSLSRLTDQILNHALIIHRSDAVPRERLDLRRVAASAAEESDHDLLLEPGQLGLDLPEDPVWVRGDAFSLIEASKNLVTNALRHGAAPVTLVVRLEGRWAVLAVIDQGSGIPEGRWADVRERYVHHSGASVEGAGLGLAIVTAVVAAHQGQLRFARRTRDGFEAALVLPLEEKAP